MLHAALAPAEAAYRLATGVRNASYARGWIRVERAGVPVISIGNLLVGGSGKTPVTAWLAAELRRRGARPAILHGGYAADEPALHRRWNPDVPVLTGRDRVARGREAEAGGVGVLILDDGFQHRRLGRDLDLVLVPAESWTARPRLLPRGPWREPPESLRRADAVAITRREATAAEAARVAAEVERFARRATVAVIALVPAGWRRPGRGGTLATEAPAGETVAVAGIAEPEHFRANAATAGARVADALWFPDHHCYTAGEVEGIERAAAGRAVVTTAKDAVKLCGFETSLDLWVLEQKVVPEQGAQDLLTLLDPLLEQVPPATRRSGGGGGK